MELNNNRLDLNGERYAEVRRASESRVSEIRETIENVTKTVERQVESVSQIGRDIDSIELSSAAQGATDAREAAQETAREARVAELRAAHEDGSLFDRDRLARAAERLLTRE